MVIAGCAQRAAPSAKPAPTDALEPQAPPEGPPPAIDISGDWVTGSGAEPEARSFTLTTQCLHHPAAWILQQNGTSLQAFSFPESFDQGAASKDPPRLTPTAKGKISGLEVTLDDATSHYRLHYDSASGHLRGTLNGRPVWAVRRVVVSPAVCLPPA